MKTAYEQHRPATVKRAGEGPWLLGLTQSAMLLALFVVFACTEPRSKFGSGETRSRYVTVDISEGTGLLASLSPDGARIALTLMGQLWMVPARGGTAQAITDPRTDPYIYADIAWASNSQRLAAWTRRTGTVGGTIRMFNGGTLASSEIRSESGIFRWSDGMNLVTAVLNADSTAFWRYAATGDSALIISVPGRVSGFDLAWDGRRLVYALERGDERIVHTGVWEVSLRSATLRQLATDSLQVHRPTYAPDAQRIAFLYEDDDALLLAVVAAGDGAPVRKLNVPLQDVHDSPLSWTPAGDSLLVVAAGKPHLVPVPVDGPSQSDTTALGFRTIDFVASVQVRRWSGLKRPDVVKPGARFPAKGLVTPTLSPSGSRIAFAALGDLWQMNGNGSGLVRLTETSADEIWPRWSPDGTQLAYFATDIGHETELRILRIDGSASPRVVTPPAGLGVAELLLGSLAWSPDGERLVYFTTSLPDGFRASSVTWLDVPGGEQQSIQLPREMGLPQALLGWTPSGDSLVVEYYAFSAQDPVGHLRIVHLALEDAGTRERPVPEHYGTWATWSPLFNRVAYVTAGRGFHTATAPGSEPVPLVDRFPRMFSWAADGSTLLYAAGAEIRLLDVQTNQVRTVPVPLTYDVPPAPEPILIQAVRIVDGTGAPASALRDVLLSGGRIAAIAPAGTIRPQEDVLVIRGEGRTLLPGLINLHVHFQPPVVPSAVHLYHGVTTVRDMHMRADWLQAQRERIRSGELVGPRLYFVGGWIVKDDLFRSTWAWGVDPDDPQTITAAVGTLDALGADAIKARFAPAGFLRQISEAAHEYGLPVTSHNFLPQQLVAGIEGKEHARVTDYDPPGLIFRQDVLSLVAAADVCFTPTLVTFPISMLRGQSSIMPMSADDAPPTMRFLAPSGRGLEWLARRLSESDRLAMEKQLRLALENVARLHSAGVLVATGTDTGSQFQPLVHLEMELLVKAGLSPVEAIRAATLDAARCLGVDHELGSVEQGKIADLILVDGNASEDITTVGRLVRVFVGGRAYTRGELLRGAPRAAEID